MMRVSPHDRRGRSNVLLYAGLAALLSVAALMAPHPFPRIALTMLAAGALAVMIMRAVRRAHRSAHHERAQRDLEGSVSALVTALETRDPLTRQHAERVAELATQVARQLQLSEEDVAQVRYGALLMDVGRLSLEQPRLHEHEHLTHEEWSHLRTHPELGFQIASQLPGLGRQALAAIRYHHERWDGRGYPVGLKGENIPLAARVVAICAEYDQLTTDWPERSGWTPALANSHISTRAGTQFDPRIVTALLAVTGDAPGVPEAQVSPVMSGPVPNVPSHLLN